VSADVGQVLTHECPAVLCTEQVGPDMLMCPGCWYQVPKPARRAVWIAWRCGAGAGTPAHRAAIRLAVAAVNRDVVPASSLKHPARGIALESTPRAGLDSQHRPGGQHL
jgi:hypothetical protein